MQCLTAVLHAAEVSSNAEKPLAVNSKKSAYIDAEAFSIQLRREFTFRLRDEKISDDGKTRRLTFPRSRYATLGVSR
jgi:hypothetical protein